MAKKVKLAKSLREFRATGPAPIRREPARPAGLYLLELRRRAGNELPKRKLVITIDGLECEDSSPKPIKITHT
jgi:hypothetical protein